jgi:hypothetical protein
MDTIRMATFCPHYCNRAPQTLIHSQVSEFTLYDVKDGSPETALEETYVASCDTCNGILLYGELAKPWTWHGPDDQEAEIKEK